MTVTRPIVRYHGGKWKLAPWIIANLPPHRIYVEPFGGGGSVLLRKPRSYAEVYNDLDGEIVNVFRVMRDRGAELREAIRLTPFSRAEFAASYIADCNPLEQARRTILRSFQGFGSAAACGELSGFRANSNRSGTTPAHDWANYADAVEALIERLRGVVIEQRDAMAVMVHQDGPETLHYVDPPYVHSTRSTKVNHDLARKSYKHELTDQQHEALASGLKLLDGAVVLSGYASELYCDLYAGWRRVERVAHADGARERIECLWLNERASDGQKQQRLIA
ncbi:MAG TPA: DNA adenine methylase [Frateuria sp.]|uniref:DNA adenine methylase n=1 Tax=Frateuria sp. TaxID=2211372 RepID=UPI002DE473AA|nr:DNA adenine methylase [Frateuria sp.]